MNNGTSPLGHARLLKHLEELRKQRAVLTERLKNLESKIANLNTELVEKAAPDRVDAKRSYLNGILVLLFALLLGTGFVFFAEYSLQLIGFQWEPWKLYVAGLVFWLGTLVTTDIYLSVRKADFSSLPPFFRVFPLALIIIGVVVLALARGLGAFSQGATTGRLSSLAEIAQWSGLIAQVTLSLGLDLGSGVLGWVGVNRFNKAWPIWQRYKEIESLDLLAADLKDTLAELQAELETPSESHAPQPPTSSGLNIPTQMNEEPSHANGKPGEQAHAATR